MAPYDFDSAMGPLVSEAAGHHGAVEVRILSGKVIATLAIESPKETVGALRHRLLKSVADEDLQRYGHSWLVSGCSVLPEHRPLRECLRFCSDGSSADPELLALTLVCARPSSLAEHLAQSGLEAGSVVDVADSVFQAEHATSMRHQPEAKDIVRSLSPGLRAQVVDWLAIACSVDGIDHHILHGAILTLDRYCACRVDPIDESLLYRICLAILCTQMKLASKDELSDGYWQRLLIHLGQGREGLPDIFSAEAEVLRCMNFNVWVPTVATFLDGLGLRLHRVICETSQDEQSGPSSPLAALQLSFAHLFLEMVAYDVFLQYRFPSVVLAASMLGAAQFATKSWSASLHNTLLEDLASYCPDLHEARGLMEECEELILKMWLDCTQWRGDFFAHLCERHTRLRFLQGVQLEDINRFGEFMRNEASPEAALDSFHSRMIHEA